MTVAFGLTMVDGADAHGGQAAHRHGVAVLQVAVTAPMLIVQLDRSLDNLLGLERAPRSVEGRAAADRPLARLKSSERVVTPTAVAGTLASAEVVAPVLQGGSANDGHADIVAEWRFRCREPARLPGLVW